jgi:hypothetical protein
MPATTQLSLAGQTQRWKFHNGPTANSTFEHTFHPDGTVKFRSVDDPARAKSTPAARPAAPTPPIEYASFEVAPGLHLVSYLSDHGYTLTVLVNTQTRQLTGFASNEKEWYPLEGTLM